MLTDLVKGRTAQEVAVMPKEELLDEIGIPLTPGAPQVRASRARACSRSRSTVEGHAAPGGVGHLERRDLRRLAVAEIDVCPLAELPPGTVRIVEAAPLLTIGVYNCDGELFALEDQLLPRRRPLCEGDFDCGERVAVCPRHGARFDIATGRALTLPAYIAVETYPARVRDDGMVVVDA